MVIQGRFQEIGDAFERAITALDSTTPSEQQQLTLALLLVFQKINDRGGLARSLQGLGDTAQALGHRQAACHYLHQALQIATNMHWIPLALSIFISLSELLKQMNQPERSIELLALVLSHPAGDQETRAYAQQLLARDESQLPPQQIQAAMQGEKTATSKLWSPPFRPN